MKKYWPKMGVISLLVLILLAFSVSVAAADGWPYHVVQQGETLFSIGRLYGVNPYRIAAANHLYNPNWIYEGQVLYIPQRDYGCRPSDCGRYGYSDCSYGYGYPQGGCSDFGPPSYYYAVPNESKCSYEWDQYQNCLNN